MKVILVLAMMSVGLTILTGVHYLKKDSLKDRQQIRKHLRLNLMVYVPLMLMALMILIPDLVYAAGTEGVTTSSKGIGLIAAAASTGLATLGAGYAVGAVGSSALGAVSEDPKLLGKTLIFVGLAEGIAIYGLIVSILILGRL